MSRALVAATVAAIALASVHGGRGTVRGRVVPGADRAAIRLALEQRTGHTVEDLFPIRALLADAPSPGALRPGASATSSLGGAASRSPRPTRSSRGSGMSRTTVLRRVGRAPAARTRSRCRDRLRDRHGAPGSRSGASSRQRASSAARSPTAGARDDRRRDHRCADGQRDRDRRPAPAAELLVAKVVTTRARSRSRPRRRRFVWAVEKGARVINMSLGGLRDPRNPARDTYSQAARPMPSRYAVRKESWSSRRSGTSDQAPSRPGGLRATRQRCPTCSACSALAQERRRARASRIATRSTTTSRRRARTCSRSFPGRSPSDRPACVDAGLHAVRDCDEFRAPEGTSFAAPQVSAAAANLVLGVRPLLRPEQVVTMHASGPPVDATAATGCQPMRGRP